MNYKWLASQLACLRLVVGFCVAKARLDEAAARMIDKLSDRVLMGLQATDMDNTALWKPGHLTMHPRTSFLSGVHPRPLKLPWTNLHMQGNQQLLSKFDTQGTQVDTQGNLIHEPVDTQGKITLAKYLTDREQITITAAKKLIRRKQVEVNGKTINKIDFELDSNDDVKLKGVPTSSAAIEPKLMKDLTNVTKLEVVYEDEHIAVVNKPVGMPVFETAAGAEAGMNVWSSLLKSLRPVTNTSGALRRPKPVHILDMNISGLLVCAKTMPALRHLSAQFENRKVDKRFLALVVGDIKDAKMISIFLDDKSTTTHFRPSGINPARDSQKRTLSTIEVMIETGRTDQIRRHLALYGHPLINDVRYWKRPKWDERFPRNIAEGDPFCLVAQKLSFVHPATNSTLTFNIAEPRYFADVRKTWSADQQYLIHAKLPPGNLKEKKIHAKLPPEKLMPLGRGAVSRTGERRPAYERRAVTAPRP